MNAFRIKWANVRQTSLLDLSNRYSLPNIECLICCAQWKDWGNGVFQYPAFKFDFLNEKEFGGQRVVSLEEFDKIRLKIQKAAGRPVEVIPGASIGELFGNAISTRLDDFAWGQLGVPQIRKRARDIFLREGINLLTTECSIKCRGKKLDSHVALQVEPVSLMTKASLERHKIFHCPRCGNFEASSMPRPKVDEGYLIDYSRWPENQHLVRMTETSKVIPSQHFMEAVKKYKLTGISFEVIGSFVKGA